MSVTLTSETIQTISKAVAASSSTVGCISLYNMASSSSACTAVTLKGAKSYSFGTSDPRVTLFTKSVRGMDCKDPDKEKDGEKYLEFLLDACWEKSPLDTLRLVFHIRDCRGGKGERLLFRSACHWLMAYHSEYLETNLIHIPFYGCWKDLLRTFLGTSFEKRALILFTDHLRADKARLGTPGALEIDTSCAKFAPSEGCSFDKKFKAVSKMCQLFGGINKATYRKEYLRPLRAARVPILEELMCSKRWEDIKFELVPSIAGLRYKKAFIKHTPEAYQAYLASVSKGEKKINVSVLDPSQIVKPYLSGLGFGIIKISRDATIEAQWAQLVKNKKELRAKLSNPVNILPIIDVSGSMLTSANPAPIEVSISLGLLVSLLNDPDGPWYKKWLTFSTEPKMETLKGDELHEMICNMDMRNWQMSTNLEAVFKIILQTATFFDLSAKQMPQMLIIISDMQFDHPGSREMGCADVDMTNWEALEELYQSHGYTRPTIVWWNVAANTLDIPVPHSRVPNTAMVGGFSSHILNDLIDGDIPDPYRLMRKIIDKERYERISLPGSGSSSSSAATRPELEFPPIPTYPIPIPPSVED